jgi:RimJ/RimL family protein N-acetyltransferase
MCGDVNIFLSRDDDTNLLIGEIEIMIAEEASRGRGIATEALWLMMRYGMDNLGIDIFEAKILEHNTASLDLFRKKLEYQERRFHQVFREHWLEFKVTGNEANKERIIQQTQHATTTNYE